MSNKWVDEEIEFLKDNYKEKGAKYCSNVLNRKIDAVRKKAYKLGISFCKNRGIYEIDFLKEVVRKSISYKDVLTHMGLRAAGGNYKIIKKYINLYNISISHFEKRKIVSGKKKPLIDILIEGSNYSRTSLKKRLFNEGLLINKCCLCGQDQNWKGFKISLILDHINGVHNDNRIDNLRIVCPNCNAGLDTFAGRNNKKSDNLSEPINESVIDSKTLDVYLCLCGNSKSRRAKSCKSCHIGKRKNIERPTFEILLKEIEELGYCAVGRKYGVSDNAIRKWIKNYQKNK